MANENALNMNAILREINAARRTNRNMGAPAPALNPNAPSWSPSRLNPNAPSWSPPELPDEQVMNAYLREINQARGANMPNQRRRKNRKTRKNRKSRKNRKASRRA